MTAPGPSPRDAAARAGVTLRLLWPQWQGAGTSSVTELASEFPFGIACRGYAVGSAVLAAILPPNQGPVATAPVTFSDEGLEERDGIEAKTVILGQLAIAEFFPRQVMHLQQILDGFPLISGTPTTR
jgi:arginase